MTTHNSAVDHSDRRLLIALPEPYDAAREHYETFVPAADSARFHQMTSWQAVVEPAKSQAPRSGSSRVSSGCNEYVVGTVRPRGRRTRQGHPDGE